MKIKITPKRLSAIKRCKKMICTYTSNIPNAVVEKYFSPDADEKAKGITAEDIFRYYIEKQGFVFIGHKEVEALYGKEYTDKLFSNTSN